MKKILFAGLVGGLVVFVWGAFSHMVLPVGEMGLKSMPVNSPLLDAMKANLTEEGLYFFPGREAGREQTEAEDAVWATKYRMGPTGLLLLHPEGREPMSVGQLAVELATDVAAALLLAWLLSQLAAAAAAPPTPGRLALLSAVTGAFGWISISFSHWNWYGFPAAFVLAELIDQVVAWGLAGLTVAYLWRRMDERARLAAERIWQS
jgi:hypothetical protein